MKKIYEKLGKIEIIFCSVLLICIVVLVFASIWMRFFKNPIIWTIDISQLLFAWFTFVGADVAYRKNKFVGVDILIKRTPVIIQNIIGLFINIVILITCLYLVTNGVNLTLGNLLREFQTLPITYAWVNSSLPIGCMLMSLTAIDKIFYSIKNKFINKAEINV